MRLWLVFAMMLSSGIELGACVCHAMPRTVESIVLFVLACFGADAMYEPVYTSQSRKLAALIQNADISKGNHSRHVHCLAV